MLLILPDAILQVYVVGDDPGILESTLVADQISARDVDPAMTAARREYATRAVLQRLHQQQCRRMVLVAYREPCICRLQHLELPMPHILPDRHPNRGTDRHERPRALQDQRLGLPANITGIDPDACVHVREDIPREKDTPMLKHGLQQVAGSRIILPMRDDLRPNQEYLV